MDSATVVVLLLVLLLAGAWGGLVQTRADSQRALTGFGTIDFRGDKHRLVIFAKRTRAGSAASKFPC